ncbi:hypothetical protein ACTA71_009392 [Dictyostelium dimigraforme]
MKNKIKGKSKTTSKQEQQTNKNNGDTSVISSEAGTMPLCGSTSKVVRYQTNHRFKSEVNIRCIKQQNYLIPELSFLTGLTDEAEESNIEPFRRIETLNNFISGFNSNPTIPKELELWDISYQQSLKVDGFILQSPKSIPINNTASLKKVIPQNNEEVYKGIKIKSLVQLKVLTREHLIKVDPNRCNEEWFCSNSLSCGIKAKLVYTVVKKNINARFFTNDNQRANPPPGTLIDSKITHKDWYDFFLVSQVAFKGSTNQTITISCTTTCQFAYNTVGLNVDPSLSDKLFFL